MPTDPFCCQQLWLRPQPNANGSQPGWPEALNPRVCVPAHSVGGREHRWCCLNSCGLAEQLQPGSQPLPAPQLLLPPADTDEASQQHLLTHLHGQGLCCHTPAPRVPHLPEGCFPSEPPERHPAGSTDFSSHLNGCVVFRCARTLTDTAGTRKKKSLFLLLSERSPINGLGRGVRPQNTGWRWDPFPSGRGEAGNSKYPKTEALNKHLKLLLKPQTNHTAIQHYLVLFPMMRQICQSDYRRLGLQLLKNFFFSCELGIVYTERKKNLTVLFYRVIFLAFVLFQLF